MGDGDLQEEAAYAVRPDCLLALLIVMPLDDYAALYTIGALKYAELHRNKDDLQFLGEAAIDPGTLSRKTKYYYYASLTYCLSIEERELDEKGRPNCFVITADATNYHLLPDAQVPPGSPPGVPLIGLLQMHELYDANIRLSRVNHD